MTYNGNTTSVRARRPTSAARSLRHPTPDGRHPALLCLVALLLVFLPAAGLAQTRWGTDYGAAKAEAAGGGPATGAAATDTPSA